MSLSPFTHPFLYGLFGDAEISALFSAAAETDALLRFEIALAQVQAECGMITPELADIIAHRLTDFTPDMAALSAGVARDGVVIPELVRQLRLAVGEAAAENVHFGATSQDVIDTGLMLRLKAAAPILQGRLSACIGGLAALSARDGARPLMEYTRMQAAIPMTVADRVAAWRTPLERSAARLAAFSRDGFPVQFGGAAGTLEKLGPAGPGLRAALAARLGLSDRPQWHSQRDGLAEFAGILSLVTGSLGKIGQDVALMAENGHEIRLSGGGGSSAMPHKRNPVDAELLVTLARYNALQLSGMHQALVHEQERSGAAWMLEWLILPQMVAAAGVALSAGIRLIETILTFGGDIEK